MLDVLMAGGCLVLIIMTGFMIYLIQSLQDTIAYQDDNLSFYRQKALSLNRTLRLDKRDGRL